MLIYTAWTLLIIFLTIFLILTLKILFIFLINLKSNKVINKSVLKQIYSGKLSFAIIMLFFAISFSLVGGAQILDTLGNTSVSNQFNNNHLYQNQFKGDVFNSQDKVQSSAIDYRNKLVKNNINEIVYDDGCEWVNTWLIDNTLLWYKDGQDYNHSNDVIKFNKSLVKGSYWCLNNKKGDVILDTKNLDPNSSQMNKDFFTIGTHKINLLKSDLFINNTRSYGWNRQEYCNALYLDFKHIFFNSEIWKDYQIINHHKDSFKDFAIKFITAYFGGDPHTTTPWIKYGQMIALLRVFDNYHPKDIKTTNDDYLKPFLEKSVSNFYYKKNTSKIARDNLKKYMKGLSYINTLYSNQSAKLSLSKKTYEFVVKNNINWATGEYLHEKDNNPFVRTTTKNKKPINNTTYLSGIKSDNEFLEKTKRGDPSNKKTKDKYNIIVQDEFLKENHLKNGDNISFNNKTEFNVVASVKFNEVTYPIIGHTLVSDMKNSAFVGINLTDFINLKSNNELISRDNEFDSFYFGINSGYDKLNKLSSWEGSSKAFKFINKQVNYFNKNIINATQTYEITGENIIKFKSVLLKYGINVNFWNHFLKLNGKNATFKSFYLTKENINWSSPSGFHIIRDGLASINDLSTLPSIRAKLGVEQIMQQEKIINFLVIVFIVIVLIVISMLVTKRIKNSGKQLGTLKAMGMKNKSIASAYIIYPLTIILSGFVISSLVSIPVSILLIHLMKGFYYITFFGNPLSLKFLLKMLLIPLVLSIGVTYIIATSTLKKPILDLLNNKGMNSPNIFVRGLGYITPTKTPFILTYTTKGFLRAMGKSTLLFFAIFISTFLVAFSLSSTTMLKKQTETTFKYINLRSISKNRINNSMRYASRNEFIPREPTDDNPQTWIESYKINEKGIDFNNFPSLEIKNEKQYNDFLDLAQNSLTKDGKDAVLFEYVGDINDERYKDGEPWHNYYYFTKKFMTFTSVALMTAEKCNDFHLWEMNRIKNHKLIFNNLEPLIKSWTLTIYGNAIFNNESIPNFNNDPGSIVKFMQLIKKYGTDLTLNEQYYNQFQQYMVHGYGVENYQSAFNYKNEWDYLENKMVRESLGKLSVMDSLDSIRNSFGAKGTHIGEDLYNKLKPYENITIADAKKASSLDYIPVIISTQSEQKLIDGVKKGLVVGGEKDGIKTYLISLKNHIVAGSANQGRKDYHFTKWREKNILIKVGVLKSIYTGIDLAMVTDRALVNNYLKYYFEHDFNGQVTDYKETPHNTLTFSKNKDYWIRYLRGPKDQKKEQEILEVAKRDNKNPENIPVSDGLVQYNEQGLSTYNFSKNMPKDWEKNGDLIKNKKIFPVASVTLEMDQFWNASKPWGYNEPYTVKRLLESYDNPYNKLSVTQGYPITINDLLEQVQVIYKLTIAIFDVISLFAVFIAGTVIVIAMKDLIDSSKREVAMLKALGYTNIKSTALILLPYIIIIAISFLIALPISFYGLGIIATFLKTLTGNPFTFTISLLQWLFLSGFVIGIIIIILIFAYISFYHSKPLEAIQSTDD